jgi:hypothetical protein
MSVDTTATGRPSARRGRGGPPLPIPAVAYGALTVAAGLAWSGPLPTEDAAGALATLQAHPVAAQVSAVLLIGASAPLAVWTASVTQRLQVLGARVAGPVIGLVGGVLAAASLLLSGLVAWTAAGAAPLGDAALVRALSTLAFALGGVGFAVTSALLIAGVAVPGLILRLMPRGLAIAGIVVAVAGVLSLVSLLVPALAVLLPVTRFGGVVWFVAVSVALPLSRRRRTAD